MQKLARGKGACSAYFVFLNFETWRFALSEQKRLRLLRKGDGASWLYEPPAQRAQKIELAAQIQRACVESVDFDAPALAVAQSRGVA